MNGEEWILSLISLIYQHYGYWILCFVFNNNPLLSESFSPSVYPQGRISDWVEYYSVTVLYNYQFIVVMVEMVEAEVVRVIDMYWHLPPTSWRAADSRPGGRDQVVLRPAVLQW